MRGSREEHRACGSGQRSREIDGVVVPPPNLPLHGRAEQRVHQHADDAGHHDGNAAPVSQKVGQPCNKSRASDATRRSQGRDTPVRAGGDEAAIRDQSRRRARKPADLAGPGICGRGSQRSREGDPVSSEGGERSGAPVREHLPLRALSSALSEQAAGNKKGEEQHQSPPSESPDRRQANRERRRRAAPAQPPHSPNNSRNTRFLSSAGAPCVRHRARKNFRNNSSKSYCSPHGGQSSRCSRISRSRSLVSSRSRNS